MLTTKFPKDVPGGNTQEQHSDAPNEDSTTTVGVHGNDGSMDVLRVTDGVVGTPTEDETPNDILTVGPSTVIGDPGSKKT